MNLKVTEKESALIERIVKRTLDVYTGAGQKHRKAFDIRLDIIATHKNGCPLDLERMADSERSFDVIHDVVGIERHLNRETGQLTNCFLPRFAKREEE